MSHTQILALMSIILGIFTGAFGIRCCLHVMIEMIWLNTRVTFRMLSDNKLEEVNYEFGTAVMYIAGCFPLLGLALILGGIKYL